MGKKEKEDEQKAIRSFSNKKCYECLEYLPLEAKVCPYCKKKVGTVDRAGMAKKPFDWIAYSLAIITWAGLAYYIYWAFFTEPL